MKNQFAVEMHHVTKFYDKKDFVFEDMTISFPYGKIIGLIGENGSGKTTFIKLISGMTKQNSGDIFVLGEKVTTETKTVLFRNYISILGDANRALYWNITGMDNIEYFWSLKTGNKYKKIPDYILAYIDDFDMNSFIHKRVETYSKGMKQRLLLLISLLNDPLVLFMDEPLNGLDYENAIILKQMISVYSKKKGATVFITSHDQNFLNEICDLQYTIKDKNIVKSIENNNYSKNLVIYIRLNSCGLKQFFFDKYGAKESMIDEQIIKLTVDLNNTEFYREIAEFIKKDDLIILEARAL